MKMKRGRHRIVNKKRKKESNEGNQKGRRCYEETLRVYEENLNIYEEN